MQQHPQSPSTTLIPSPVTEPLATDSPDRYEVDDRVEVRYPGPQTPIPSDRDEWPWLPGTIVATDVGLTSSLPEYQVSVDVDELAEVDDEDDTVLFYPLCFRDPSEIRRRSAGCTCGWSGVSEEAEDHPCTLPDPRDSLDCCGHPLERHYGQYGDGVPRCEWCACSVRSW